MAVQAGGEDAIRLLCNLLRRHQGRRKDIVMSLGETKSKLAVSELISILYNDRDEACHPAMIALSDIGREAVWEIIHTPLANLSLGAQWRAVKTIEMAGFYDEAVRDYLIEAIKLGGLAQLAACEALARRGDYQTLVDVLSIETARFAAVLALERLGTQPLRTLLYFLEKYPEYRSAVIEAIGRCGDKSVAPILIKFLQDPDASVRKSAAVATGRIKADEATDSLVALLKDEDTGVRQAAIYALGDIGSPDAVPHLIEIAENTQADTLRLTAVTALGKIRDRRAVPVLTNALQSPNNNIRAAAIESLGKIGDPQSVPALLSATSIENCYSVACAVAEIPESVPFLVQILEKEANIYQQYAAILGLGMMKAKQAVPYIRDRLTSEHDWLQGASIIALGQIGGDAIHILSAFLQAHRTHPANDGLIVDVLSNHINDSKARSALIWAINHSSPGARARAILAAGKLKIEEAVEELIAATAADSSELRYHAVNALASIGDPAAIPAVASRLQDPSDEVRKRAVRALADILSKVRFVLFWPERAAKAPVVCVNNKEKIKRLKRVVSSLKQAAWGVKDYDAFGVALEIESRIATVSFAYLAKKKPGIEVMHRMQTPS